MAAGDTLVVLVPTDNEPPGSNYATIDNRNNRPVLDFDPAINESAIFTFVMPNHYAGGGVDVYLHYAMSSATSGSVDWDTAFERVGDGQQQLDSDGFAAAKSVNVPSVPGTAGLTHITKTSHSSGEIDGLAAGESGRLKVTRDGASDTAAGDAELVAIELRET